MLTAQPYVDGQFDLVKSEPATRDILPLEEKSWRQSVVNANLGLTGFQLYLPQLLLATMQRMHYYINLNFFSILCHVNKYSAAILCILSAGYIQVKVTLIKLLTIARFGL